MSFGESRAKRTVVRGGLLVGRTSTRLGDVCIDDGRIASLEPAGSASTSNADVIDAGGLAVFAGAVDPHVHFDEPGRTDWEGFESGSVAAAAGGVTTVIDMPIDSAPPTTTAARVRGKVTAAERASVVDVGVWGGLIPGSTRHLDDLASAGVVGYKAFACPSGWRDFPPADEKTLAAGFSASHRHDLPVALHCELERLGHSLLSEVAAIAWAAGLATDHEARLHVVHASSAHAVDEAGRWPGVTVETCPHYLLLTDADVARIGAGAHCAPPVRDFAEQGRLWSRVIKGTVCCIASDHSPCPPELKNGPHPWAGVSGVQTTLAALLTSGRLDLPAISRLRTDAARLLNLPAKGRLEVGADADLALVDLDATWVVQPGALHCRHRQSPFIGRTMRGVVRRTLVRGETVYLDGAPTRSSGGRFVRPHAALATAARR